MQLREQSLETLLWTSHLDLLAESCVVQSVQGKMGKSSQ